MSTATGPDELVALVRTRWPRAEVSIDRPLDRERGSTWIDIRLPGPRAFVVEWRRAWGFGVSRAGGEGYGDAHDLRVDTPADVCEAIAPKRAAKTSRTRRRAVPSRVAPKRSVHRAK